MPYDFTHVPERKGTNCLKYDAGPARKGRDDLLPLWVADMDLRLPDEVLAPLHDFIDHGIFGYGFAGPRYDQAVTGWYGDHFSWRIDPDWMVQTPGVVYAIGTAINAFTEPGDAVLIQQPVYYPFENLIRANGRVLVNNELVYDEGRYRMDFEGFERAVIDHDVKLFVLCSPHNPVGRVWTADELRRVGDVCKEHGVVVVSDEIHADFTYPGHTHQVFATLSDDYADFTVTCTAPSKTFNLAGFQIANIVISNPALRRRFRDVLNRFGYGGVSTIALAAAQSAYENGGAWHEALKEHLRGNLALFDSFLREHLPEVRLVHPEGTYLLWVDFSAWGLADGELDPFIVDKARLWLDAGAMFGTRSSQFERFNIACPRETLIQALHQLEQAKAGLGR